MSDKDVEQKRDLNELESLDLPQTPPSKAKGRGDIVFTIDVTTSMRPCIEGLKKSLNSFFEELDKLQLAGIQKPSWRIKFITFKDLDCPTDTEPKIDFSRPFVESRQDLVNELNRIVIEDYQGCDEPESIWEAIYVAVRKTDWRPATGEERVHRVIVALTDAPPKEKFNTSVLENDDKDAFDPNNKDEIVEFLYNVMAEEKIKLILYAPEHEMYNKLTENAYKALYINVGAPSDKRRYEGLKNIDYSGLMKLLVKTISG